MKLQHIVLVILLALGAGYLGSAFAPRESTAITPKKETTYERVIRTGTLRCGYAQYDPMVRKDPNTGKMSGIAVELMEKMGALLKLKVEWAEEVGWATVVEGLNTGRYDAMCVGFWRLPTEGRYVFYSAPFAYSMMDTVVRPDDTRFDTDIARINQPDIKIISADGLEGSNIAKRDFPNAQLVELPNMTDEGTLFSNVITGKADVFFEEASTFQMFLKDNPGKLKRVNMPPMQVFQDTIALPQDEKLKSMIDTALYEILESGTMDKIIDQYDPDKTMFRRVQKNYQ